MEQANEAHIVFLPVPLQGHVKPFLTLAELISHAGLRVTFVNSHYNQSRLERSTDLASFCDRFPKFRFVSVSDGLSPDHQRSGPSVRDLVSSTKVVTKVEFRKMLVDLIRGENIEQRVLEPPTCVIADGYMSFGVDIAEELGIPVISFSTTSASSTWAYCHFFKLIEQGEVPFQGDDMDKAITCIPGFESIIRRRDLPGPCRFKDPNNFYMQHFITEMAAMRRSRGLILNTLQGLEAPVISKLGSFFPRTYAIGPLHGFLETLNKEGSNPSPSSSGMFRVGNTNCLTWLDGKLPRSAIYVSFGSLVGLTRDHLMEIWYGLVNSEKHFLWVIRPDAVIGEESLGEIPEELEVATKERGLIVEWAPQVQVLAHPSIGAFMTHSGWNSTLESLLEGVPMICWPGMGDQLLNSRFVGDVWKMGLDMKDTCDRKIVEKMVRDLMVVKQEEFMVTMDDISRKARGSLMEGGSSYGDLNMLIHDLKFMASERKT